VFAGRSRGKEVAREADDYSSRNWLKTAHKGLGRGVFYTPEEIRGRKGGFGLTWGSGAKKRRNFLQRAAARNL